VEIARWAGAKADQLMKTDQARQICVGICTAPSDSEQTKSLLSNPRPARAALDSKLMVAEVSWAIR
jgi:hypothetical protein